MDSTSCSENLHQHLREQLQLGFTGSSRPRTNRPSTLIQSHACRRAPRRSADNCQLATWGTGHLTCSGSKGGQVKVLGVELLHAGAHRPPVADDGHHSFARAGGGHGAT